MPLGTSSIMHISIAIYKNDSDDWSSVSPFPGEVLTPPESAFVISTCDSCTDGSLHLVPGRLIGVESISNQVDFFIKTLMENKAAGESSGIGGMSKLKDFSFSIIKNNGSTGGDITNTQVLSLYGRKIILFIGIDSQTIQNINSIVTERQIFVGRISSPKINRQGNEIVFFVKGLLDTYSVLVGGAKVETSEGNVETEPIVFGDCGEMFVPLVKKKVGNKTVLQFSQGADYIIKDLYVKVGSDNDPVYCKINTSYNLINNEITFNTAQSTSLRLINAIGDSNTKLTINGHWEIGIVFTSISYMPVANEPCIFHLNKVGGGTPIIPSNKLIYSRTESVTIDAVTTIIYFFKCGWECIYGYIAGIIDDGAYNFGGNVYNPYIYFGIGRQEFKVDYRIIGEVVNPLEKEIDALGYSRFGGTGNWNAQELKDFIQKRTDYGIKTFQTIPPRGLIIKVDNEEMLVIYTEKDSAEPAMESALSNPLNSLVWVIRGWNGTSPSSHLINTPITLMSESNEQIFYTLERKLQSLNTVTPSKDYIFSDFNKFLNEEESLSIKSEAGRGLLAGEHDPVGYIGLDFNLPDLSGDLYKIFMTGEASCGLDNNETLLDWLRVSIALALNPKEDATADTEFRQQFGKRRCGDLTFVSTELSRFIAFYQCNWANNVYTQGKYIFDLDTSWEWSAELGVSANPIYNKRYSDWISGRDQYSNIKDYDELKETNFFLRFNSSSQWKKKSWFTLSLPTLNVIIKSQLKDMDIYAKVIPKSIFDSPKETYDVGTNCKICWSQLGNMMNPYVKEHPMLILSDDDLKYFGYIYIKPNVGFDLLHTHFSSHTYGAGYLVENAYTLFDTGKVYPSVSKVETYGFGGDLDYIPNGLLDVGKILIENGNCYIWSDQVTKKLKIIEKTNINNGNPAYIIKRLFEIYCPQMELDTDSFTRAISDRSDWRARVLVEDEIKLVSLVDMIAKEHGLIVYENNLGKIFIVAINPPILSISYPDITLHDIIYDKNKLDYEENFTEIEYLITEMDVYYDYINNKFQKYIKSSELPCVSDFIIAKTYTNTDVKIKLSLKTIYEKTTALKIATLKSFYHRRPTRILTIRGLLSLEFFNMGIWNTISGGIPEIVNKLYLIIGKKEMLPYMTKGECELVIFEYDWSEEDLRIQEVPEQSLIEDYDEVPVATNDIDEVPNV